MTSSQSLPDPLPSTITNPFTGESREVKTTTDQALAAHQVTVGNPTEANTKRENQLWADHLSEWHLQNPQ